MEKASHKKPCVARFHLLEMFRIVKSMETNSRLAVAKTDGRRQWGVTANGYGVTFGFDENVVK